MEGQSTKPGGVDSNEGFLPHLRQTIAALSTYFGSRFELAAIEGQEAFVHYLKFLVLVAAALLFLVFGYVFLCMGIVLLAAEWTEMHVGWISLILFGLHGVAVAVCLLIAKNMLKVGQFQMTLEEFRNDRTWLR
jgi:uncharacterized membrane protein YqjE